MSFYNPANWYWAVGGSTTQVWSSAAADYVPVADATYVTWLAAGNLPTQIDTEDSLHDVLLAAYPAGVGSLGSVPQKASVLLESGTVILTSTGTPALNGTYSIAPVARGNITAIQLSIISGTGLPGGSGTFPYLDISNTDHFFSAAQFTAFATAVINYVFSLIRCANGKLGSLPSSALTIA